MLSWVSKPVLSLKDHPSRSIKLGLVDLFHSQEAVPSTRQLRLCLFSVQILQVASTTLANPLLHHRFCEGARTILPVATSSGTHTCSLIRNVEALLVEAQGLASLTGMKAKVL